MKSLDITGKTVDEAIFKGLDEMGLSIDQVDIEIIEEGGKRLFGTKPCVVRLIERDPEAILKAAKEQAAALQKEKQAREESRHQPRYNSQNKKEFSKREQKERPNVYAKKEWGLPTDGGKEKEFLLSLLEKMGVQATIECFEKDNCLYMNISGEAMAILIGRRGETLNAMQYMCNLFANKKEGPYVRVVLDTENYRSKRDATLVRLAKKMADEAHKSKKMLALEPMNPYERRIMHATLQSHPYVTTHSVGEEPNRHVVVVPK